MMMSVIDGWSVENIKVEEGEWAVGWSCSKSLISILLCHFRCPDQSLNLLKEISWHPSCWSWWPTIDRARLGTCCSTSARTHRPLSPRSVEQSFTISSLFTSNNHLMLLVFFSWLWNWCIRAAFPIHTLYILLYCRWWKHLVIASGRALFLSSCLESSPPQVPPSWPMMTSLPSTLKSQNFPSWLSGTMVSGVQGCRRQNFTQLHGRVWISGQTYWGRMVQTLETSIYQLAYLDFPQLSLVKQSDC